MERFVKRSILDLQVLCILNKFHVTVANENQSTAVNLNLDIRKANCQYKNDDLKSVLDLQL